MTQQMEKRMVSNLLICMHYYNSLYMPHTAEFLKVYHNAQRTPTDKYTLPMTSSQEIGWDVTPLVSSNTSHAIITSHTHTHCRSTKKEMIEDSIIPDRALRLLNSWTHSGNKRNKRIYNSDTIIGQ